jgi:hypothetical protein
MVRLRAQSGRLPTIAIYQSGRPSKTRERSRHGMVSVGPTRLSSDCLPALSTHSGDQVGKSFASAGSAQPNRSQDSEGPPTS